MKYIIRTFKSISQKSFAMLAKYRKINNEKHKAELTRKTIQLNPHIIDKK